MKERNDFSALTTANPQFDTVLAALSDNYPARGTNSSVSISSATNLFNISFEDFLQQKESNFSIAIEEKGATKNSQKENIRISVPQEQLQKFKQVLFYVLRKVGGKPNIAITALYKLLYFIDFDYYEKYEEQLMGLVYIKNNDGPTPVVFKKVTDDMIKKGGVRAYKK